MSGGDYIRFVFIGSSTCPFSNNDNTHNMVNYLKESLKKITELNSINFIVTGLSVDLYPQLGLNYLKNTYPYHEVMVGSSVYNLGSVFYSAGNPSTPHILIIHEKYDTELVGINLSQISDSQQVLHSFSGVFEIKEFYNFIKSSTQEEINNFLSLSN
ncbi:hypothetical protein IQ255_29870 [Pleurocapsales cyanobacterium LEGE 10410]|nr:hypothetical protein [Pleurocapsales cyanobacterium LEGE 10410]